jgi:hypothetical protein
MYITIAAVAILMILAFIPDFVKKKPAAAEPSEAEAENERLKAELEALKAQLEKNSPEEE